jgi:hypothetical protein
VILATVGGLTCYMLGVLTSGPFWVLLGKALEHWVHARVTKRHRRPGPSIYPFAPSPVHRRPPVDQHPRSRPRRANRKPAKRSHNAESDTVTIIGSEQW